MGFVIFQQGIHQGFFIIIYKKVNTYIMLNLYCIRNSRLFCNNVDIKDYIDVILKYLSIRFPHLFPFGAICNLRNITWEKCIWDN